MRVHRNLHKACWSVTVRSAPVQHVDTFCLSGVRFIVSQKGRDRVLTRKQRAVHAWADGAPAPVPADVSEMVEVCYNPYRAATFLVRETGEPVECASLVVFTASGKCLVQL
jgi:hypothetical protein